MYPTSSTAQANAPLVSIVMPAYNHGRYIGDAIASVRAQTLRDWELIVVDNHSLDDTSEVVRSFEDPRIVYLRFNNRGIIAAGRNVGLQAARGRYIAFLDSDDLWLPEKLAIQVAALRRALDVLLVSTNGYYYPSPEGLFIKRERILLRWRDSRFGVEQLLRRSPIINSSVLVRRSATDKVGLQDENPALRTAEDYDYWLRIVALAPQAGLSLCRPLVLYRVHGEGMQGGSLTRNDPDKAFHELARQRIAWEKHTATWSRKIGRFDRERSAYARRYRHQVLMSTRAETTTAMLRSDQLTARDKMSLLAKRSAARVLQLFLR